MKTILKTISTLLLSFTVFVGIIIATLLFPIMVILGAATLFICWLCLGVLSVIVGVFIVLLVFLIIAISCIPVSFMAAACLTGLVSVPESIKEISEEIKEFFKDDDDDKHVDIEKTIKMKMKEGLKGFPDTWGN